MTIETLEAFRDIRQDIESMQERIERLRASMERLTRVYSRTGVSGGFEYDKLGAQMAELDERERLLHEKILELERLAEEADAWLQTLPPNQRTVMRLRYVDGYGWRKVAKKAGYCERQCRRINYELIEKMSANVRF